MKRRRGMTLVELLVIIPIISIVVLGTYNLLFLNIRANREINKNFNNSTELRVFMKNINAESKSAKKVTLSNKVDKYPLTIDGKKLEIYTDIYGDGPECVIYYLKDRKLIREIYSMYSNGYNWTINRASRKNETALEGIEDFSLVYIVEPNNSNANSTNNKTVVEVGLKFEEDDRDIEFNIISKSRGEFE